MVTYVTPGVYFKTSDQDQRAIDFLRTDIAAFIGIAERGALHTPTRVNSWAQFNALFGGFLPGGYLAYSVKAFFENGGRTCVVIRVAHADARAASVDLPDELGVATLTVAARSPGTWGERLAVQVTHTHGAATVSSSDPQPSDRLSSYVDSFVGFGSGALVRIYQPKLPTPVEQYRTLIGVQPALNALQWDAPLGAGFNLAQPIYFEIHDFTLSVYLDGRLAEVHTGLAFTDYDDCADDPTIKCSTVTVVNAASQLIDLTDLHSPSLYADRLPAPTTIPAPLTNGVDGLTNLTTDDFTGDPGAELRWGLRTLELVDEVAIVAIPDINIQPAAPTIYAPLPVTPPDCCIEPCPPTVSPVVPTPPELPPKFSRSEIFAVQQALVRHCETQRDRIALLDPPYPARQGEIDLGEIQSWRQRFDSSYAALYYPWVLVYDPLRLGGQVVRAIPPSGHVAGIYARSDTTYGVHKAPANEPLRWAQDVLVIVNDAVQGILNPLGINAVRPLNGRGLRVYGARTLSSDTSWRYVNVRRLLMMIEEAVDESLQWAVFEPNDFNLRQLLILTISSFLRALWQRGALVGAEETDAFFVKCDEENNPPYLAALGQLIVDVGVAPVKPAEFVVFSVGRIEDGFTVSEQRGV